MTVFNPNFVRKFDKLAKLLDCPASVVGTSTKGTAVYYPFQRKGFYAAGRFWAFYSNGTNAYYESTTDPSDWSGTATSIGPCVDGYDFSVCFDGTYVHYSRYYNYDLFYRRGTPISDGTITWSADEQTVHDGSVNDNYRYPCISVDSNGYAWVGVRYYNGTSYYPYVLKNVNNDGTWSTDFSYQLNTTSDASWVVQPVPLTSGKVYVVYGYYHNLPRGKLYTGSWGSEETDLADYTIENDAFCAVAEGDNVHFVYNRATTYQFRYNKRVYGTGWGVNDVLVQDSMGVSSIPALSIDTSTGNLYCFWLKAVTKHVYYKKYTASTGTWDTDPTDWIDESTDGIAYDYFLNSYYQKYSNYIGLLYVTKTASPYNVKFDFLTITAPPPKPKGTIAIHAKLAGII